MLVPGAGMLQPEVYWKVLAADIVKHDLILAAPAAGNRLVRQSAVCGFHAAPDRLPRQYQFRCCKLPAAVMPVNANFYS